jgi:hypothetical protein
MNLRKIFLAAFATAAIPACLASHSDVDSAGSNSVEDEAALTATSPNATYYTVRRDPRLCPSPLCGGYFVKRVNQTYTYCPGGGPASNPDWTTGECYVATADFGTTGLSGQGDLWRGSVVAKVYPGFGNLRQFVGTEAWRQAGTTAPTGTFYRVNDTGIECITYPCLTHREAKLNSTDPATNIAGVDLSAAHASQADVDAAYAQMGLADGVMVGGTNYLVTGPAGKALALKGSEFYLRIRPASAQTR